MKTLQQHLNESLNEDNELLTKGMNANDTDLTTLIDIVKSEMYKDTSQANIYKKLLDINSLLQNGKWKNVSANFLSPGRKSKRSSSFGASRDKRKFGRLNLPKLNKTFGVTENWVYVRIRGMRWDIGIFDNGNVIAIEESEPETMYNTNIDHIWIFQKIS